MNQRQGRLHRNGTVTHGRVHPQICCTHRTKSQTQIGLQTHAKKSMIYGHHLLDVAHKLPKTFNRFSQLKLLTHTEDHTHSQIYPCLDSKWKKEAKSFVLWRLSRPAGGCVDQGGMVVDFVGCWWLLPFHIWLPRHRQQAPTLPDCTSWLYHALSTQFHENTKSAEKSLPQNK